MLRSEHSHQRRVPRRQILRLVATVQYSSVAPKKSQFRIGHDRSRLSG